MTKTAYRGYRFPGLGAAILLAGLHVLAAVDGVQDSYAGYVRDDDNVITVVGEGDPAQRAPTGYPCSAPGGARGSS